MEQIIGVILTISIIVWLFSMLSRVLLRSWLSKKQRQMEEQLRGRGQGGFYTNSGDNATNRQSQKKEGEITIENNQPSKKVNENIGEYIDYEEL